MAQAEHEERLPSFRVPKTTDCRRRTNPSHATTLDLEAGERRAMDREPIAELIESLETDAEATDLVGVFARSGEERPRHPNDVDQLDWIPVMSDEKLGASLAATVSEADVGGALIICVLNDLLKAARRDAVELAPRTAPRSR